MSMVMMGYAIAVDRWMAPQNRILHTSSASSSRGECISYVCLRYLRTHTIKTRKSKCSLLSWLSGRPSCSPRPVGCCGAVFCSVWCDDVRRLHRAVIHTQTHQYIISICAILKRHDRNCTYMNNITRSQLLNAPVCAQIICGCFWERVYHVDEEYERRRAVDKHGASRNRWTFCGRSIYVYKRTAVNRWNFQVAKWY